ncbi:hypothetical protein [Microcoleus vaginatus]|uniref:hypothetical protein n=1 Tax=Microcoleus vaginatus TaxID=119532 RepID=UPI001F614FD4
MKERAIAKLYRDQYLVLAVSRPGDRLVSAPRTILKARSRFLPKYAIEHPIISF